MKKLINKIKESILKNRWKTAKIIITIMIIIPLGLNVLSYILHIYIKESGGFIANGSGWLGFWGSYIGGIATLIGVLLTLYIMNLDKGEKEKIQRPIIMALSRELIFTVVENGTYNSGLEYTVELVDESNDMPYVITILNAGKEHSLNVTVDLDSSIKKTEILLNKDKKHSKNELSYIKSELALYSLYKATNSTLDILVADNTVKDSISMPMELAKIIHLIIYNIATGISEGEAWKNNINQFLGILNFSYSDTYGKPYTDDKYNSYLRFHKDNLRCDSCCDENQRIYTLKAQLVLNKIK